MNIVDTLFANVYAVIIALGLIYGAFVIVLALRARNGMKNLSFGSWTTLSVLTLQFGVVSGRAQLITLGLCALQAIVLNAFHMPKFALMCIVSGVAYMLLCTVFAIARRKVAHLNFA